MVFCSVCIGTNSCYLHSFDLITHPRQKNVRRLRYLHDGPTPMLKLYFILVSVNQLSLVALLYSSALTMKTREIKKIYYIKDVKYFYQVFLRNLKLNTASFVNGSSCLPSVVDSDSRAISVQRLAIPSQVDPSMLYFGISV